MDPGETSSTACYFSNFLDQKNASTPGLGNVLPEGHMRPASNIWIFLTSLFDFKNMLKSRKYLVGAGGCYGYLDHIEKHFFSDISIKQGFTTQISLRVNKFFNIQGSKMLCFYSFKGCFCQTNKLTQILAVQDQKLLQATFGTCGTYVVHACCIV